MARALRVILVAAFVGVALAAQSARDLERRDYEKRLQEHRVEAAQRYVDIGWWARKAGMVPQATTQFLRAAEVGNGEHQMADRLVSLMRSLGDGFWRGKRKKIPRAMVTEHDRRVAAADRRTRREHVQLAQQALAIERADDAREHCRQAMRLGAEIEVSAKGASLDTLTLPTELADWLREHTVATAGGRIVFEAAAAAGGPRLQGVHEVTSERLIVRTDIDAATGEGLHALARALLPHLEERLEGSPTRPLVLLVFARRTDYDDYLRSLGVQSAGAGLAEYGSFQTIVCAEGKAEPELHALVLHELAHLYFFGVAPAAMPDWYAEGLAESFGGQGTFSWDGKVLTVGGAMHADRLVRVKQAPLALAQFFAADAEQLWATDRQRALDFYAQAWALQRFLRSDGCRWQQAFADWEAECRGGAVGAVSSRRFGDRQQAQAMFDRRFGKDLAAIEQAFVAWLQKE